VLLVAEADISNKASLGQNWVFEISQTRNNDKEAHTVAKSTPALIYDAPLPCNFKGLYNYLRHFFWFLNRLISITRKKKLKE
jgi:hypothetical protein